MKVGTFHLSPNFLVVSILGSQFLSLHLSTRLSNYHPHRYCQRYHLIGTAASTYKKETNSWIRPIFGLMFIFGQMFAAMLGTMFETIWVMILGWCLGLFGDDIWDGDVWDDFGDGFWDSGVWDNIWYIHTIFGNISTDKFLITCMRHKSSATSIRCRRFSLRWKRFVGLLQISS